MKDSWLKQRRAWRKHVTVTGGMTGKCSFVSVHERGSIMHGIQP